MKILFLLLIIIIALLNLVKSNNLPLLNDFHLYKPKILECIRPGEECVDEHLERPCSMGHSCQLQNETMADQLQDSDSDDDLVYVCKNRKSLGEPCIFNSDCKQGLSCFSPSGNDKEQYCIDYKFSYYGEPCEFNHQCVGSLKCQDSICTNTTQECIDKYDCPSEFYCNAISICGLNYSQNGCPNARCVPVKTIGSTCSFNFECPLSTVCAGGKCIEKYSLQRGQTCFGHDSTPNDQCDISKSLVCKQVKPNLNEFKCLPRNETKTFNCRYDGCLYDDEICDGSTNRCVTKDLIMTPLCKESEKSRNFCYVSNKCAFLNGEEYPNLNKRSCSMKNCVVETIEHLKQCDRIYSLYLSCNNNNNIS
ncbi:hypothetical protein DDB_G0293082 [Dictyostelium discoideum AX4]|uniref:Dickkopf N-terminal cysteine-rich domain-containing protein n=1 Tax=Dictyostelium discoideum TaxID=44689 RepID=Q54CA9_DICDI|nr:hypothetical protein DDB_G0293082 [Dictyostelium discoideum AX4]EAL60893.1 hypothetical protein DDB_G0293082 [Dictyostelium discoideum AX4]|eukprot:XP_629310.1 hypothetical protein DDB_G0293082 [Dictyostelium discoideum AX4]